ncbi:MAG: glycosyltransferase family 4 protein [Selenomonadaceae bacterium]|nr:glycosyltransferase family 4 protein [Selenomonadaceae bacterium]
MKIAIFENIMTPGGHEVDFDRIIVEEFQKLSHEVNFYVPENFTFQFDYKVPIQKITGEAVTYTNSSGIRKLFAAAKREINRRRWYQQLYDRQAEFDVLIVPTSTYRYLRSLNRSVLRKIDKPIIFILHGINPSEVDKFFSEAEKLLPYKNVKLVVLTFGNDILGRRLDNVFPIYPPTYTPRDIDFKTTFHTLNAELKIGFFGQYRREKKLEDLLEVFIKGRYTKSVKLIVQGSTMHAEDSEDFERIISKYSGQANISFLHKGLIGAEWQEAIAGIDALLMPYSAPRYKYHWSGMLFTAIGFQKPVIASDDMNPEVFDKFNIGETFKSGDLQELGSVLENFINNFDVNATKYAQDLSLAGKEFSPEKFTQRLLDIILSSKKLFI